MSINSFATSLRRLGMAVALIAPALGAAHAAEPVNLTHVHGLAFSADGTQLKIPSHHGLAVFEAGRWSKAPGPQHDYMGFSATHDALYSSGHPAPGTGLVNPFGLIKSVDGGRTWHQLGLQGESDFHELATGYRTNVVYVVNHARNSRMEAPGIYFTRNDGFTWQRAEARGVRGKINAIAVHPDEPRIVAVATDVGVLLSRDSGDAFEPLTKQQRALSLGFDLDGKHLWFGSLGRGASLHRVALAPGAEPSEVRLPELRDDAVAFIAQNPTRPDELAIATFRRNVFLRVDARSKWVQIARDGETRDMRRPRQ